MPGRKYAGANSYRYGFNGMEKDDEIQGDGNSYDFDARIYDSRLGRFFSTDPMEYEFPWQSPYVGLDDNPILLTDPNGESTENPNDGDPKKKDNKPKGEDDPGSGPDLNENGDPISGGPNDWDMRHAPKNYNTPGDGGSPMPKSPEPPKGPTIPSAPEHNDKGEDGEDKKHPDNEKNIGKHWGWAMHIGSPPNNKPHKRTFTWIEWSVGNKYYNILGQERVDPVGQGTSYHSTGGWRHKRIHRLSDKKGKTSNQRHRLARLRKNRANYFGMFIWGDKHQVRMFNKNIDKPENK